jgi:hypothetical protein
MFDEADRATIDAASASITVTFGAASAVALLPSLRPNSAPKRSQPALLRRAPSRRQSPAARAPAVRERLRTRTLQSITKAGVEELVDWMLTSGRRRAGSQALACPAGVSA